MIAPLTSLAFSIFSNKGVYALLLGSGISSASGIPTGWGIIKDLVLRIAKVEGQNFEDEDSAIDWYKKTHDPKLDYSTMIELLAKTKTERQALLRDYFEPNKEEKENNGKSPNEAHYAIARLVANGYVKIIVTTNFDALLESAINSVGISPLLLSTPDQMDGSMPLRHAGPTIIKIHGDYRSDKLKNTDGELSEYETQINNLLDEIFDQYGLIISGWSGDWDPALRKALERRRNHRYSTYWTRIADLSLPANKLAKHLDASIITISGAESFFTELEEKVKSLQDLDSSHPLSEIMTIATIKRYLPDPLAQIRLEDLIKAEADYVVKEISRQEFSASNRPDVASCYGMEKRVPKYELICWKILKMLCVLAHWGNDRHVNIIVSTIQRIASVYPQDFSSGYYPDIAYSQLYPALLLFYAVGLTRMATGKYDLFSRFDSIEYVDREYGVMPLNMAMLPKRVLKVAKITDYQCVSSYDYYLEGKCLSDYLFFTLEEPLKAYIPGDKDYASSAELFEYCKLIQAIYVQEQTGCKNLLEYYFPTLFFARGNFKDGKIITLAEILANKVNLELQRYGLNWEPLSESFCGGDVAKLKEITKFISDKAQNFLKNNPHLC
jgi:NAD-dependent SIR2 family protein deacetylase